MVRRVSVRTYRGRSQNLVSVGSSPGVYQIRSGVSSPCRLFASTLSVGSTSFMYGLGGSRRILSRDLCTFGGVAVISGIDDFSVSLVPVFHGSERGARGKRGIRGGKECAEESLSEGSNRLTRVTSMVCRGVGQYNVSAVSFLGTLSSHFKCANRFIESSSRRRSSVSVRTSKSGDVSRISLGSRNTSVSVGRCGRNGRRQGSYVSSLRGRFGTKRPIGLSPPSSLRRVTSGSVNKASISPTGAVRALSSVVGGSGVGWLCLAWGGRCVIVGAK